MPTGHLANVNSEQIVQMYSSGMTIREISKAIGYSRTVVSNRLEWDHVIIRDRSASQKGKTRPWSKLNPV